MRSEAEAAQVDGSMGDETAKKVRANIGQMKNDVEQLIAMISNP